MVQLPSHCSSLGPNSRFLAGCFPGRIGFGRSSSQAGVRARQPVGCSCRCWLEAGRMETPWKPTAQHPLKWLINVFRFNRRGWIEFNPAGTQGLTFGQIAGILHAHRVESLIKEFKVILTDLPNKSNETWQLACLAVRFPARGC